MTRAAALLCLALAACGSKPAPPAASPSESPSPTSVVSSAAGPAVSAVATPSPLPSPKTDLADGRTYAYLKTLDTAKGTVTFDVVQFLTGDEARKAAEDDGHEADNDYYIRNVNARLRTLAYKSGVTVVVNTLTAEETGSSTQDKRITVARLKEFFDKGEAQQRLFYLTLSGGTIAEIHEQYLP